MASNYTKWAIFNILGSLYWTLWLMSNAPPAEGLNTWSNYLRTWALWFSALGWFQLCFSYLIRNPFSFFLSLLLQYGFLLWYLVVMGLGKYGSPCFYSFFSKYFGLVWYFAFMVLTMEFLDQHAKNTEEKKYKKDIKLEEIKIEKEGTAPPLNTVKV